MSLFKMKEPVPEVVNNHVVRTVIEAKYTIKDLTLEEVKLIRDILDRVDRSNGDYYYRQEKSKEGLLLAKIQL